MRQNSAAEVRCELTRHCLRESDPRLLHLGEERRGMLANNTVQNRILRPPSLIRGEAGG